MDEQDKKKILEIQLNKPGTKKKPGAPGEKPAAPKAPAPTPGAPAPAAPAPSPAKPITPAARARMAKLILRKINRRRVLAQVEQPVQPAPAAPAPAPAVPAVPAKVPGEGPAKVLPEFEGVTDGGTSEDGKALQMLTEVQEMEVAATTPSQVSSLKASYLAQKLLTELGMTIQDVKKIYGLGNQKGLTSLFE